MPFKSRALEINLASYHVDVHIAPRYLPLRDALSRYYGLVEGVNAFLTELSHPYKNWKVIVQESRKYGLDYFHIFRRHPAGPDVVGLIADIFLDAISENSDVDIRTDAADNLMLFLQKVIAEADTEISRFIPVLEAVFDRIHRLVDGDFGLFVQSYYSLRRLASLYGQRAPEAVAETGPIHRLICRYCHASFSYWLSEDDPLTWFEAEAETRLPVFDAVFQEITHPALTVEQEKLGRLMASEAPGGSPSLLESLLALSSHERIVEAYRKVPMALWRACDDNTRRNQWKVIFLFHIMNVSGLSLLHEDTLQEINRTLSWLIANETHANIIRLIQKTFSILKERTRQYPVTAMQCALNMGKGVYKTVESDLVNVFTDAVIDLGFQTPMVAGVGNDWQIQANSAHIQNIRTWMELIELNPKWSTRLLSCLIIHLRLEGIFIKDTDLFPRDITRLLSSDIGPVYNLIKQLTRIFPAFFNDIGAEGELREISTRLDELTRRKDVLIHFLRKQSHVESSNQMPAFMDAVFDFWKTGDREGLEPFIPPDIFQRIVVAGPFTDGVRQVLIQLESEGIRIPEDLLTIDETQIVQGLSGVSDMDVERVRLMAIFYKLLHIKYHPDALELRRYLGQLGAGGFPGLSRLQGALEEPDVRGKAEKLIDYLEFLKNIILSPTAYEIHEDIYKKRHIAVDIPSMYGSYHEMKFDALGLTFRLESLLNVLLEELATSIDLTLITHITIRDIAALLTLFDRALKIDGIQSVEFERQQEMLSHALDVKGFTFTQYLDIFKGFSMAVSHIIHDYFNNVHEENLNRIIAAADHRHILPRYRPQDGDMDSDKQMHRISEIFFRDQIVFSLGLQQLDRLLTRILTVLFQQVDKLHADELRLLLLYDPGLAVTTVDQPAGRPPGIIYIGNKGLNMVKLKCFGLPVPPGFIITTEAFRCRDIIENYPPARRNFREQIRHHITTLENATGKTFGDPRRPLLFSVRSGASISQPGMMDTLLNVGINERIAEGLADATGNAWFAWDNYRRFLQCYGMALGLERDHFDAIIDGFKQRFVVPFKRDFSGSQMKTIAFAYRQSILDAGYPILEDPWEQLYMTIYSVFQSWDSDKARAYRNIMGISDDWGTAVTVQAMVYGNLSRQSGTGVIFTHNPRWPGDRVRLWGDFTIGNQGEDVVSGLVNTMPISLFQQDIEMRDTDVTLETRFPEIYTALKGWAIELIEKKGWTPQEMEFTFESPSVRGLYLLQTRDMAMRERKKGDVFDPDDVSGKCFLGHGVGVGGGAMSGRVVFTLEEIDRWRQTEPQTHLILLRSDTVPDDIREIHAADGLLTARGGLTSHAAVVAHRLGKTCVVGCSGMICHEKERSCEIQRRILTSGDIISIDGQEGSIYLGAVRVRKTS